MTWRALITVAVLILPLALPNPAWSRDEWEFSGFASIGAGKVNHYDQSYIEFEKGEWSLNSDTMLGLQANKQISDRWGFAAQVVSKGTTFNESDPYTPELEWLFLSYELNNDTRLRAGRLRNPFYLFSTTQEVGYTYTWARPPVSVYHLFFDPFKHLDGVDATFNTHHDDFEMEYQLLYGVTGAEYEGIEVEVSEVIALSVTANWFDFKVHVAVEEFVGDARPPESFDGLRDGFNATGATLEPVSPAAAQAFYDVADAMEANDQRSKYYTIGAEWLLNDVTLMSEYFALRGEDRNYTNDSDGYYVSAAYQMNEFTPYLVYGEYENRFSDDIANKVGVTETFIPQGDTSVLNAVQIAQLDGLRAGARFAYDQYNSKQAATALGIRYDFHAKANVKFEVEYFEFDEEIGGTFFADDVTKPKVTEAVVTSFVVDVVF